MPAANTRLHAKYRREIEGVYGLKLLDPGADIELAKGYWALDKDGYIVKATLRFLRRGTTPQPFRSNDYLPINLGTYLRKKDCVYLDHSIKGGNIKLKYIATCGHIRETRKANLDRGKGLLCLDCARETYGSNINLVKLAKRHREQLLKEECTVYLIGCHGNGEEFYKIGITKNSLAHRYRPGSMPYKYEKISIVRTNRYEAILFEDMLHRLNENNKYRPAIYFQGYTECFSKLEIETIDLMKSVGLLDDL